MRQDLLTKSNSSDGREHSSEFAEELVIEGGEIAALDTNAYEIDQIKKHRATTARILAYVLIAVLTLSVAAHIGITIWLGTSGQMPVLDSVDRIFNAWLPIITGFAGAAVTYFLRKEG